MQEEHRNDQGSPVSIRKWVFIGFLLMAGFFLFTQHRAHVFGLLPYLFLLACPLMHLFHHGHRHGKHGHGESMRKPTDRP